MEKEVLTRLSQKIRETNSVPVNRIPDIELYMEQLLSFLNQHLNPAGKKQETMIFTKTMINNYTKDHILIPPKNKKYSRQHVLLLILIHNLKGMLTISEIKRLFAPVLRDINIPDDDLIPLESIYAAYVELTESHLEQFSKNFTEDLSFISAITKDLEGEANLTIATLFLTVLSLISQANLSRHMAEMILETYFPPPADGCEPHGDC